MAASASDSPVSKPTLTCQTNEDDHSIQCSFTLNDAPAVSNHPALTLEDCVDDNSDSICIQAQVSAKRRTGPSPPSIQHSSSSSRSSDDSSMTIIDDLGMTLGRIRYNKPYTQEYSHDIYTALHSLERLMTNINHQPNKHSIQDEAQAYVTLASAHSAELQQDVDELQHEKHMGGAAQIMDMDRIQTISEHSMNAYDQAVRLYRGQLQSLPQTQDDAAAAATSSQQLLYTSLLAHVYFYMSDLWSLVAYFDEPRRQDAKEYMLKALELFRFCKDANLNDIADSYDEQDADASSAATFTSVDQMDAAFYWGQSLMRLGTLQMAVTQALQLQHEHATVGDFLDEFPDETKQQELLERLTAGLQDLTASIQTSQSYFEQAAEFFAKELETLQSQQGALHPADIALYQINLASALQNSGDNQISLGLLADGTADGERALTIYEELLKTPHYIHEVDLYDTKQCVADLLFSLSRAFLQQADYDKSKHYYHRAMDWYATHDISPSGNVGDAYKLPEADGTIDEYEELLEEYKMLKDGASDVELPEEVAGYDDEGAAIFEANDAYESSIHSTLGYLYMSTGDLYQATSHMSQALFLFQNSAVEQDEMLADLLYNMAMLKFSSGEFQESASFFDQAVEVFRIVAPHGENPLSRSVDSISLESIQAMMHAEALPAPSRTTNDNMGQQRQKQESLPARKVLTLQRIEDEPKKVPKHEEKRPKSNPGSQKTSQPKLNLNLEDFRSHLKQNETRDEL